VNATPLMEILAIIPARANSKRVKSKNHKILNGKPLIEYTIDSAKGARSITDILITTDDEIIYNLAKYHNVLANRRPKKLCEDDTSSQAVIDYIIKKYNKYDYYVLLQPTSPFRTSKHIDDCINVFLSGHFDSLLSVKELVPNTYYPNGAVYVFKAKIKTKNMGMVLMSEDESIDIDTLFDFKLAEVLMNEDIRNEF